jgi:aryl-alcohol dehydrogenase-like predicted oxidoreductase
VPAVDVVASLERSLRNLNTDYIDVFMLHGVAPAALDPERSEIVPTLLTEKAKGKLRHLGITFLGAVRTCRESMHRRRTLTRNRPRANPIALSALTLPRWRGVRGPMVHRLPVCTWST